MAVFSSNQVTQFFVLGTDKTKEYKESKATKKVSEILTEKGDFVAVVKNGKFYINVKGAKTILRTPLVDVKNIMSVKIVNAAAMRTPIKQIKVSLSESVNGGNPIVGQDYTLHVMVRQYQSMSDESTFIKTAAVHVTKDIADSKEKFYAKLKDSLELNFKRELNKLFEFTSDATGVTITEVEQDWILGTYSQVPVYFEVWAGSVYLDGDEVNWAGDKALKPTNTEKYVGNGKKIADMEYFYVGERGDQYRQIGWPNYIKTDYCVDETKEYHTLNIHFAYVGQNESIQKSEQELMLVSDRVNSITSIGTTLTGAGIALTIIEAPKDTKTTSET